MGIRSRAVAGVFVMLIAVQAAAGCTRGHGAPAPSEAGDPSFPGKPAKPATLEQLAARTGCKLETETKATELRQGSCKTSDGRYTMLTFVTDKAKESWLGAAKEWGGTYLIGPRWVIVGTQQNLQPFYDKVGGEIEAGDDHGGGSRHQGHTPSAS
ncbi:hypothetical protein [Actinomadura sp. HBU206391]|uniref:hypothetical protein n=1 Tax=Actinomadura sp. HBU206391 TaxID=2731692 RepID=UPI00164F0F03|nr:hypothetical protein [Actinomadura sp. HBU206391]MBC6463513.1 hypothetical protein [Actinomadura sp. HBU206391]